MTGPGRGLRRSSVDGACCAGNAVGELKIVQRMYGKL